MKARNGLIEIARWLFTIFVLVFHSNALPNGGNALFRGGWLGVEFFFLIAGFFMAQYEDMLPEPDSTMSVARDTTKFMLKRTKRLLPFLLFSMVINFIVWNIPPGGEDKSMLAAKFLSGLINFVGGYATGFKSSEFLYVGYSWTIAAMLVVMYLLFPLIRKNRDMFYHVYGPLFVLFGMGLFAFNFGGSMGIISTDQWVLSNGTLRSLFEISMGCICYRLSKAMQKHTFTAAGARLLSVLFIVGMLLVSYRVIFLGQAAPYCNDYLALFLIAALVIIAFSGKSSISFTLSKKASYFSGEFTYALYICSNCWSYLLARLFPDWAYQKALIVYLILAVLCAFACMAVCFIFGKLFSKAKGSIRHLIIAN